MNLFSNDMRVANTAAPSFEHQANVGQFGWTGADQGHYNQLLQYVDECRKIWLGLEEKILFIEELLKDVTEIDGQIKYIEQVTAQVVKLAEETKVFRDQTATMYTEIKPLVDNFFPAYEDALVKYREVILMHSETEQAAIAAAQSELAAAASAKLAADTAEELRKGQVYRGTWNLEKNARYPDAPDTNSVWDITLNESTLEFNFDSKKWFWGDRLLYLKDENAFSQIESGSSVVSVNGKSGAVTLSADDVNAINKDTDTMKGALFFGDKNKYVSTSGNTLYVAAKEGNVVIEGKSNPVARIGTTDYPIYHRGNKPSPDEIGAVTAAGFTLTGPLKVGNTPASVQNVMSTNMIRSGGAGSHATVVGNTSGRTYIDSPDDILIMRAAGVERRVYTQGYKPTAADVGALSLTGGEVNGRIIIKTAIGQDSLALFQTPNSSPGNAVGVSGYEKSGITREWGAGVFYVSGAPSYTYFGTGSAPWSKGLKLHPNSAEINQKLNVNTQLTVDNASPEAIVLNYVAGEGGHLRGKEDGVNDWYVGRANPSGHVALYSNKLSNGLIIRDDYVESTAPLRVGSAGHVFFNQHASTTDLNTLSSAANVGVYYQDANSNATAARHYPIVEAGTLLVTGSAYGVQQEYTTFSSHRKFVRGKSSAGSDSWYAWKEIGGIKNHMSGFRFTDQTIASGGSVNIQPGLFAAFSGIKMSDGVATVSTSGIYKLEFGFSILPNATAQNAVGGFIKNGAVLYGDMIHNYCPANTNGSQMNISSSTVIVPLNAGDRLSFQVKAVNGTNVSLYQGGFIVITEL